MTVYSRVFMLPEVNLTVVQQPCSLTSWSDLFFCHRCGTVYARIESYTNLRLSAWRPNSGLCLKCPGNRFAIPGSIERISAYEPWSSFPLEVVLYQLRRELDFYDSPDHPRFSLEIAA